MTQDKDKFEAYRKGALDYHEFPQPGKLEIRATKPMANQRDLAKAYSPGVAEACVEITKDLSTAAKYTAKGNLVAVISNGTAVLGLGNIGAAASKPVMEGKAVLFKKFANVDCFDIEVNEADPEKLAEIVCALEPTFGAINLEDIKAPDCFIVEKLCREKMNIPVFHDDQHGTAIVVAAAAMNALRVAGKKIDEMRLVTTGGGAAGIACLNLLLGLGVKRENVMLYDRAGLVYPGRNEHFDEQKAEYAYHGEGQPLLEEAMVGADMFLGLSGPGVVTKEMAASMADNPIIFALANPTPEIMPDLVKEVRDDAIIATGRSDYPNQVNNVLCFPFIFRGALDVGASEINEEMKRACVWAIADMAMQASSAEAAAAYRGETMVFGREYLIPKPFDPRLLPAVASAVAKAAMESGVATRPLEDLEAYQQSLTSSQFRTAMVMRPVFDAAKSVNSRIVFAEGEDERVLRAANAMLEEGSGQPILVGRPEVIENRLERYGLSIKAGSDFEVVNPQSDPRYRDYWGRYHELMQRQGITPELARTVMRTNTTAISSIMVEKGHADSMICGVYGQYLWHLKYVQQILGHEGRRPVGALSLMLLENSLVFISDTHVHPDPTAEEVAEIAVGAARHARRFGIDPKVALLSHSQFGSLDTETGRKMRRAMDMLDGMDIDFQYEGEMHADSALDPEVRARIFPNSRLQGRANILILPNADSASGMRNILKQMAGGLEVGPILMGMQNRCHIVTPSVTARGLLNIAALAASPMSTYA